MGTSVRITASNGNVENNCPARVQARADSHRLGLGFHELGQGPGLEAGAGRTASAPVLTATPNSSSLVLGGDPDCIGRGALRGGGAAPLDCTLRGRPRVDIRLGYSVGFLAAVP